MNRKRVIGIFLTGGLLLSAIAGSAEKKSHDSAVNRNLTTFGSIVRDLESSYVDSLPTDKLFKTAIGAMLSELDPYTVYLTEDEQEKFSRMTTGEYGGIGSYLMESGGKTVISGPYEGAPADRAGLKTGDIILKVDTVTITGAKPGTATKLLLGQAGTPVTVTVQRPYPTDTVLTFTFDREKLQMPSISYYGMLDGNIGYIKLNSFMEKSGEEMRKALEEFKSKPNLKGVILDLSENGGGLLNVAIDIAGMFLPKGTEVVRTKGKDENSEKIYRTTRTPILPDVPLAVIIDGGSASASEIVAGALQDLDRAVLVGNRSFGKGLVQSTHPLPYGNLLKVTTAKYYIPSGRLIQAIDYSHRKADGTAAAVPDSLTNVFYTKNGREVRDGGGLKPDIEIDEPVPSRLAYNLYSDMWIFNFANKYAATHPTPASPLDIEITDTVYGELKAFVNPDEFKYDKACEYLIGQLRETAESEGYMSPEIEAQIDSLAASLTHDLDNDLDLKRKEVEELLIPEIAERYFYERGRTQSITKFDRAINRTRELFASPDEYNKILKKK